MSTSNSALKMYRGDDFQFDVFVRDPLTGLPFDVSDSKFWFTAKLRYFYDDDEAVIVKDLTSGILIMDAIKGHVRVLIDSADTSSFERRTVLRYDLQWEDVEGLIHTLVSGDLFVEMDVTRRTS